MELLQLRYFQTVARMESITRAAELHRIPQSAMSQNIARIERELGGIKLFDRRNNHIYLNSAGKSFLDTVNRTLMTLDDGVLKLQSQSTEISGSINMLVLENHRFILQCLSAFAEMYPKISFSVSHDYYSAQNLSYDLCVSTMKNYQSMRTFMPLISERLILAVHENHPLANREWVSPDNLRNENFICTPAHSSLYTSTLEICHQAGFEPKIPYICDDPYFVRKYISLNMGIALAPSISWGGRFRDNTRIIELRAPTCTVSSYLLWDDGRYISPAVKAFRDYVLQQSQMIPGNLTVSAL